jgi:hypothetical protein
MKPDCNLQFLVPLLNLNRPQFSAISWAFNFSLTEAQRLERFISHLYSTDQILDKAVIMHYDGMQQVAYGTFLPDLKLFYRKHCQFPSLEFRIVMWNQDFDSLEWTSFPNEPRISRYPKKGCVRGHPNFECPGLTSSDFLQLFYQTVSYLQASPDRPNRIRSPLSWLDRA